MGVLRHVTDSNIAAFNNMLRHSEQKGSDKTYNKRAGKYTPIVQMRTMGSFTQFISYNELDNLVYVTTWAGTVELNYRENEHLINISVASFNRRYILNDD